MNSALKTPIPRRGPPTEMYAGVYTTESEREREGGRERGTEREREKEREREREKFIDNQ